MSKHHHCSDCKGKHQPAVEFNTERTIAIRMTMQPQHTNGRGKIFGGRLLELMDLAGAFGAHRVCKGRFIRDMVTRVMNEVEFKQPVEVNDAVTFYSSVVKVGTTSVTVRVEVEADRSGTVIPVLSSSMVFVAVDKHNKPVPIRTAGCVVETPEASTVQPATDTAAAPAAASSDEPAGSNCKCGKEAGKCSKKKRKCNCNQKQGRKHRKS